MYRVIGKSIGKKLKCQFLVISNFNWTIWHHFGTNWDNDLEFLWNVSSDLWIGGWKQFIKHFKKIITDFFFCCLGYITPHSAVYIFWQSHRCTSIPVFSSPPPYFYADAITHLCCNQDLSSRVGTHSCPKRTSHVQSSLKLGNHVEGYRIQSPSSPPHNGKALRHTSHDLSTTLDRRLQREKHFC